jgi:ABC-type iron transport system FetAB permease component
MKGLILKWPRARDMKLSNQAKVGLVTVICLIMQGYIFTYVLKVEPHSLLSFIPLIPYLGYIYARSRRVYYYNKPLYWIAAIIMLTAIDLLPYALKM